MQEVHGSSSRAGRGVKQPFIGGICLLVAALPLHAGGGVACPPLWKAGVLGPLEVTPAFTAVETFDSIAGRQRDGLLIASFFNSIKDPSGEAVVGFFAEDQVLRIEDLDSLDPGSFDPVLDVERLTDLGPGPARTVWPNSVAKVPDGMLPFEAVVIPGGFHVTPPPGRLSLINLDDPGRQEYIVDQSVQVPGPPCPFPPDAGNAPRFYHQARFVDMDQDGLLDLVTVRAGFKVVGALCAPPVGEVVWFRNPGPDLLPDQEWQEFAITGFPSDPFAAEINLDVHDFEGDGVPEIVGTHFFTSDAITLYGAPEGQSWSAVDPLLNPARSADIVTGQGRPFEVEIVDLNRDGRADVLATNHQGDNCFAVTQDPIPGRVFALEQPASGRLFDEPWSVHILKDGIRPNPSFPQPSAGPGRLAPGRATAFWPVRWMQRWLKPWIVVGGDEASKVWVLRPTSQHPQQWGYRSAVVFDINDTYGPNTTQTLTAPAPGVGNSISTIGGQSVRYDRPGPFGRAEIYMPVFEGREIHVLSTRWQGRGTRVRCPADVQVACPTGD